jgi:hypothetical protein
MELNFVEMFVGWFPTKLVVFVTIKYPAQKHEVKNAKKVFSILFVLCSLFGFFLSNIYGFFSVIQFSLCSSATDFVWVSLFEVLGNQNLEFSIINCRDHSIILKNIT